MREQRRINGPVVAAGEEGQDPAPRRRRPAYLPLHSVALQVDLRQRHVLGAGEVTGPQPDRRLHGVDEPALHRVDAAAGTIVEHWRLTFLVHVHLQLLLHFKEAKDLLLLELSQM
ncbi:uncharacterized protein LOC110436771 isoform X2 [Sorghum bicolor]|uniref:uncharacterized protein LOC110436771 isoform X2 n=1 Tax=Sorghum bicolor TaxID=4558 RepID=UPI000B4250D5|nr:uncharacterized protein LOC110436771 isoform X2 [Sorghum bicolor]|eukprot:XP_021319915.1 uncharacterized protein LOC110436771 isoform X2 [Sorghum bicolor]